MNKFLIFKYIILSIVILYVLSIIYFKLRYPFWSKQPIFYYHDLRNLIYPIGVIETSLPNSSNKLNQSIVYKRATELNTTEIGQFIHLLKNNYMTEPHEKYIPKNNDIMDHLLCRNSPSYVSMYYNKNNEVVGSMSSAYKLFIMRNNTFDVGYIDNLCVDKKSRGKNIAGKIIQSHYVRERYTNKKQVFMFKHEGISRPFVPLTIYNTYFYKLDDFSKIITTQKVLSVINIGKETTSLIYDLQTKLENDITLNKSGITCTIMDEIEHISYLIEKKHIIVFALIENKIPKAFYFFKNIYTTYNDDKSIECFACIKYDRSLEDNRFLLGFYLAIDYVKSIDKYKILLFENIADSHCLIKEIKHRPYHYSKYQYYLYNYAMRPVPARNIVII